MAGIHSGHRARLRTRARTEGLRGFEPHEVLELLLMQIIPLRDVNPLAHSLIDRFGSLEGVLTAPEEELAHVPGMGERSVQWLLAMGEMALAYSECWHSSSDIVTTSGQAMAFLSRIPAPRPGEIELVCLDRAGRVIHFDRFTAGNAEPALLRSMVRTALLHHAAQVFTACALRSAAVQADELAFARRTTEMFKMVEIMHLDHIVRVPEGYLSARREGMIDYKPIPESLAAENGFDPASIPEQADH